MQTTRALLLDVFTDTPLAGEAAGVVPDADGFTDAQLRAMARELGVTTVFILPSDTADRRVRFFSPTGEVDRCSHATVASQAQLLATGALDSGGHTVETAAGVLEVDIEADGTVWMIQPPPEVRDVSLDPERVGAALGIDPEAFDVDGLPFARATTGRPVLVVPTRLLEHLMDAVPDRAAIETLTGETDTDGIYAFTFDTLDADATLHARAFAPLGGAREETLTSTAAGAVGAYLEHAGAFAPLPDELLFEQGHFADRPGVVRVRVGDTVRVGGRATVALDGALRVPDLETDDIIEA